MQFESLGWWQSIASLLQICKVALGGIFIGACGIEMDGITNPLAYLSLWILSPSYSKNSPTCKIVQSVDCSPNHLIPEQPRHWRLSKHLW